jgi:hypothetical protein
MGHWKDDSSAVAFFHDLSLTNPNLFESHAVFSFFGTRRRGWKTKLLAG